MRIGIIGPMQEEVVLLLSKMCDKSEHILGNHSYVEGKISGKDVVLVKSGIGKVCAAEAATVLCVHFKVDCVINTGCAGGIGAGLKIGDIVLSTRAFYHDFDLRVFGYKIGQVPSYEQHFATDDSLLKHALQAAEKLKSNGNFEPYVYTGAILTGDQFIANKQKCLDMLKDFSDAQVTEMEGAAVAHVCEDFKIPCLIIRSVSDTADGESPAVFDQFVQLAADNSAKLLVAICDHI